MLSLFPILFSFEPLAPFLLRLTLGVIFVFWGIGRVKAKQNATLTTFGLIEVALGVLLVIGLFTQGAALAAVVILLVKLFKKFQAKALFTSGVNYYFILFIIAVSILFLGPGAFAFDYPL